MSLKSNIIFGALTVIGLVGAGGGYEYYAQTHQHMSSAIAGTLSQTPKASVKTTPANQVAAKTPSTVPSSPAQAPVTKVADNTPHDSALNVALIRVASTYKDYARFPKEIFYTDGAFNDVVPKLGAHYGAKETVLMLHRFDTDFFKVNDAKTQVKPYIGDTDKAYKDLHIRYVVQPAFVNGHHVARVLMKQDYLEPLFNTGGMTRSSDTIRFSVPVDDANVSFIPLPWSSSIGANDVITIQVVKTPAKK